MKFRIVSAACALGVGCLSVVSAHATPGAGSIHYPLHVVTVTTPVNGSVRSVVVDADYGAITLKPGSKTSVIAHEAWNYQQPKVTITVSKGVLSVKAECHTEIVAAGVVVVGVGDTLNDCYDDLTIMLPAAAAVSATSSQGDVTSTGLTGAQQLHSDFGAVRVAQASGPMVTATSSQGVVSATAIRTRSLSLTSDTSDVTATTVSAANISLHSSQGVVRLTDATSRIVLLGSETSDLVVSHLRADQLDATTSQGAVSLTDATLAATHLSSDTSDITVNRVTSPSIDLTASQGQVTATTLGATRITARSNTSNISISTKTKPDSLLAESDQGSVSIDVPAATYEVSATAQQGTVRVTGITVDSRSPRRIEAHSNTSDVTITGH